MHMKRLIYVLSLTFMAAACTQQADYSRVPVATEAQVQRVEPLSWWTGMNTDLQILVQGPGIGAFDVAAEGKGLEVKAVHPADSPDFLFVDVAVKAAGEYNLVFSRVTRASSTRISSGIGRPAAGGGRASRRLT